MYADGTNSKAQPFVFICFQVSLNINFILLATDLQVFRELAIDIVEENQIGVFIDIGEDTFQ
jgi:hypothetical protein